jgi:hypothetical protein
MSIKYQTTTTDSHELEEELQWARILSTGSPAEGMTLVFIQKLCTAFHEFEPAWKVGALAEGHLDHFRARLAGRATHVLRVLEKNDLATIDGAEALAELVRKIESAETMAELANLAEHTHAINHRLCDALEQNTEQ